MDAFENIVKSGGGTYGVAAAIDAARTHKGMSYYLFMALLLTTIKRKPRMTFSSINLSSINHSIQTFIFSLIIQAISPTPPPLQG